MNDAMYRLDEIKECIDSCIFQSTNELENHEEALQIIQDLQSKLYDVFGLED